MSRLKEISALTTTVAFVAMCFLTDVASAVTISPLEACQQQCMQDLAYCKTNPGCAIITCCSTCTPPNKNDLNTACQHRYVDCNSSCLRKFPTLQNTH